MAGKTKKGVLRGAKIAGKHSSYIPAAKKIIVAAKRSPLVTKITLSEIRRIRGGKELIKFQDIPVGLRLTLRGVTNRQIIFIHTKDRNAVKTLLEQAWQNKK